MPATNNGVPAFGGLNFSYQSSHQKEKSLLQGIPNLRIPRQGLPILETPCLSDRVENIYPAHMVAMPITKSNLSVVSAP